MNIKKRVFSFLLSAALIVAAAVPATPAIAQEVTSQDKAAESMEGLKLSSVVTPQEDGRYHVQLNAYVTSAHKPLDIVLVLDTSKKTREAFGGTTRLKVMQDEAKNLIDILREKYTDTYHHHVGIVTYSDSARKVTQQLVALDSDESAAQLKKEIDNLESNSGWFSSSDRRLDLAMNEAQALIASAYPGGQEHPKQHQKVVLVLSSGTPKDSIDDFSADVAGGAIQKALEIKKNGTLVYTIGMFDESDPKELYGSTGFHCNSDGSVGSHWCEGSVVGPYPRDIPANNRFFNYLSSNSPDAESLGLKAKTWLADVTHHIFFTGYGWEITQNYTCDTSAGYYQSAKDPSALKKVFSDIVDKTLNAHIDLDASAVLKETVSPYFDIMDGSVNSMIVKAIKDANFEDGQGVQGPVPTVEGNDISITGFDYNKNCVTPTQKGDGSYGSKLVVEFVLKPKVEFIGGNDVPVCGGNNTGMYQHGTKNVETFETHTGNVQLNYDDVATTNQTIFLGEKAALAQRIKISDRVNGFNNAYTNIVYTLMEKDQTVGTYTIPAGENTGTWAWVDGYPDGNAALKKTTEYQVLCAVTPETGVGKLEKAAAFTITVESGTLTVTRTGGTAAEQYVLAIEKDGQHYMTISVENEQAVTVYNLPKGNYKVREDVNWSWRYGNSQDIMSKQVIIDSNHPAGTATVHAEKNHKNWLNHYTHKEVR